MDKAKATGILDFSHPVVVRAMGAIEEEAARQEGIAKDTARNDANAALTAQAAERRRKVHHQLLPKGSSLQ